MMSCFVSLLLQEANLGNRSPACATGTVRLFSSSFEPSFVARTGDWTDTFVYYRNVRGERDCGEPGVPARQGRCAEGYEVPGGEAVTGAPQLVHRRSGGGVIVINY